MYYHFDRVKSLALLGLALLSLFTLRQYNSRNMIFGNLKQDVKESLLKAIEQVHLTNQQKKIYLHENWFLKPSVLPYNLSEKLKSKKFFSQDKQDEFVDNYFKNMWNGVFLEVGAADGVTFSNTLFFEKERNWTGVLIEPNRELYNSLVTVQRKSYSINACLSLDGKISLVSFLPADLLGGLERLLDKENMMNRVKGAYPNINKENVLCIPLYSILKAIDMTHINFFSLDVEGAELEILRTIPFDLVTIDLFMIEYFVPSGKAESQKRLNEYRKFFENLGTYEQVHVGRYDIAFARK